MDPQRLNLDRCDRYARSGEPPSHHCGERGERRFAWCAAGRSYRRKTITFENVLDRTMDADISAVAKISRDLSDFRLSCNPTHPFADENGYIKRPNVNTLIEE